MTWHRLIRPSTHLAVAGAICIAAGAQAADDDTYPNPPPILQQQVREAAITVLESADDGDDAPQEEVGSFWTFLSQLAVTDALLRKGVVDSQTTLHQVGEYIYVGELQRTDKQLGAGASSSGTTTVVEKAGFPRLLSLAIEHGAIIQEENGTSLTLSTTPYLAAFAFAKDSATNYERFEILDRVGFAGTFALDPDNAEQGDGVDAEDLSTASVKVRLYGDRSTRSSDLHAAWVREVQPAIQRKVNLETQWADQLFNDNRALDERRASTGLHVQDEVGTIVATTFEQQGRETALSPGPRAALAQEIENALYRALSTNLFQPVLEGEVVVPEEVIAGVTQVADVALNENAAELRAAQKALENILEEHSRSPLVSLAYALNRIEESTDYSEIKLLAELPLYGFAFSLNGGLSFNHHPSDSEDEHSVRDYSGALAVERSFQNFLIPGLSRFVEQVDNPAPVTASLNGRISRLEDSDRTVGIVQLRFAVPITASFNLPISLAYATGTEASGEDELSANVGINLDADKLAAIAELLRGR